jgi:cytoskeletal protein RodZ
MRPALADFRIESEAVVRLAFTNGKVYRVNPSDLERYLGREDLQAIRRALALRKQFMRRVLPTSMMVFLVASAIGLASHDVYQVQAMLHSRLHPASAVKSVRTVPASTSTKSSSATSGSSNRPASPAAGPATASTATSTKASPVVPAASTSAAAKSAPAASSSHSAPVTTTPVTTPVTTVVKPVVQVLKPVTQTAQTVLGKLLP